MPFTTDRVSTADHDTAFAYSFSYTRPTGLGSLL
jgi:hypothetical protein